MQLWIKNEKAQIIGIALITAIGAEFMIKPFSGEFFRIGLGVGIFLFLLLVNSHLSYLIIGAVTGAFNIAFQTADWLIHTGSIDVFAGLQNNVAAGFYYFVYAYALNRVKSRMDEMPPLLLGALAAGIDLLSNETELFVGGIMLGSNPFSLDKTFFLTAVGVLRSYFVIGLYSSVAISQVRTRQAEQEKRLQQMLTVGSGLYGEAFYLKKSMNTIEQITANSFELYQSLQQHPSVPAPYSRQALGIAQEIHEVKKDSQRILAGLLKLVDIETVGAMSVTELIRYVARGNVEYGRMLKKRVHIADDIRTSFVTPHYLPLLTVLNNLAANAVEAIEREGRILLQAFEQSGELVFRVTDSGKGIALEDQEIIFEPGFTTKFNELGVAATGIGLSHVRDIVHHFGGRIMVEQDGRTAGAAFLVHLPIDTIRNGGETNASFFRDRG
jgi:two-component system, sensor histidine kinase YcbA